MRRFGDAGFGATSIDRICREAGVTKGAFFHYFTGKDMLIEELLEAHAARQLQSLRDAPFRDEPDAVDRLTGFVEHLQQFVLDADGPPPFLMGLAAAELSSKARIRGIVSATHGAWTADLGALVHAAQKAARPDARFDPERVAAVVVATWEGAWLMARAAGDRGVVTTHLAACRAWLRGLFGRGPYAMRPLTE